MHTIDSTTGLALHERIWQQFELCRSKGRLSHALLLLGSPPLELSALACRMAAAILCKHQPSPCGHCQSCQLAAKNEHPDFHHLVPEKEGAVIKIEQIRQLQAISTTSPQLGHHRVILISPADKLNAAAANALLKVLEEPGDNVSFMLLAEQVSTIPATIISRCQLWRSVPVERLQDDYLTQQNLYSPETGRGQLLAAADVIIRQIQDLCESKQNPHGIAQSWSVYPFADLVWLLYLLHAQMIQSSFTRIPGQFSGSEALSVLAKTIKLQRLFAQLDKLNAIIEKINHTFSMNQLLVLENFLLGYKHNDLRSNNDG